MSVSRFLAPKMLKGIIAAGLRETNGDIGAKEVGSLMELLTVFLRTLFFYFFILFVMRLMGKREIGKLSVFDLVVSIMIAELAVVSIENTDMTLMRAMLPIVTLMLTQIVISYVSLKSSSVRELIDGRPSFLIKNGELQKTAMRKNRYNMADLLLQLREQNIQRVRDVEFAILETSGKLSVFPKEREKPITRGDVGMDARDPGHLPMPLIIDGKVQDKGLAEIGKTRAWLKNEVKKRGCRSFKDIFFAAYEADGTLFIDKQR